MHGGRHYALEVIYDASRRRRRRLLESAARLRAELGERLGFDLAGSASQIVPVIVGDADTAVQFSRQLEEAGFLIPAIRPPTVPRGSSRLRISLSSERTSEDLDRLVQFFADHRRRPASAASKGL